MAYQEVTTTGYGTRVGNSFKAIGSGFLMFIAGTALLWWNEGRAVKTEKMLEEAGSAYVEMENPNKKDASLDGELICGTAMATTEDSLVDNQFGIGAKAIALSRTVEYYQWVEHESSKSEDKLGGKEVTTTTYTYSKEWVRRPVESAQFKDPAYQKKNMVLATFEDAEQYAENVSWGAYKLSESLIHSISSNEGLDLAISEDLLKQFDKSTQAAYERFYGVQKSTQQAQQPVQQPAQPAIPDSIKALLPDSVKARLDSLQAVARRNAAVAGSWHYAGPAVELAGRNVVSSLGKPIVKGKVKRSLKKIYRKLHLSGKQAALRLDAQGNYVVWSNKRFASLVTSQQ